LENNPRVACQISAMEILTVPVPRANITTNGSIKASRLITNGAESRRN
jgi:hypothetical protein